MRFKNYIEKEEMLNEGKILDFIKLLKGKTERQILSTLKSSWKKIIDLIESQGKENEAIQIINKALGTRYRNLNDLYAISERSAEPEEEGFVNWLKSLAFQGQMTVGIFTALQVFFELDVLFDGAQPNFTKILVYGFLWVLFSTKMYHDWKRGDYRK